MRSKELTKNTTFPDKGYFVYPSNKDTDNNESLDDPSIEGVDSSKPTEDPDP